MTAKKEKSLFVTFEGIDGCGKSTQALLTYQYLLSAKYKVKLLREPGSTVVAERIRDILLNKKLKMSDATELLLYEAARAEITSREISPALANGTVVLCDRFYDSTTAYQGFGRRLDIRMVKGLHKVAVGNVTPDLTFVFDVDLKTAFARRGKVRDRLESQSRAFHNRVRLGFLEIARKERRRVKLIDATGPIDQVFGLVKKHLHKKLHK
ncbi:MAG: dTMP kinase [Candidatus Zixiibacteriota bacterium]|nr:MAG: dTMP kinase [candidate division Zixibacteria bacterium]